MEGEGGRKEAGCQPVCWSRTSGSEGGRTSDVSVSNVTDRLRGSHCGVRERSEGREREELGREGERGVAGQGRELAQGACRLGDEAARAERGGQILPPTALDPRESGRDRAPPRPRPGGTGRRRAAGLRGKGRRAWHERGQGVAVGREGGREGRRGWQRRRRSWRWARVHGGGRRYWQGKGAVAGRAGGPTFARAHAQMLIHLRRMRLASAGAGVMLWIRLRLNAVSRTSEPGCEGARRGRVRCRAGGSRGGQREGDDGVPRRPCGHPARPGRAPW